MSQSSRTWGVDSEWGFRDDHVDWESAFVPVVFCALEASSGQQRTFWGSDTAALVAFFREHADDLFVAHNMTAECKYLLRQGVPLPSRWFDTYAAWRYVSNRPHPPEGGLVEALHCVGLPHLAPAVKKDLVEAILHLRIDLGDPEERRRVADYCLSDCDGTLALYRKLAGRVPPELLRHWSAYLRAVARLELRGVPLDLDRWDRIQEATPEILRALYADVNATWPIYRKDGSCDEGAFFDWCKHAGIDWPRKRSSTTRKFYAPLDDDTLEDMEERHPLIRLFRQVRKTKRQLGNRTMVIDRDARRHYFGTHAFASSTGRNQPTGFVFGGPKWLRWLIVPESPAHVLVNVDYTAQELGVAAALSGDVAMRAVYEAADSYMAFAIRAGAAPPGATKKSHPDVRKRYKAVSLGTMYGQTAYGVSARLGISHQDAERLLADHQATFPAFWYWSAAYTRRALDSRRIATPCGWRCRVPPESNHRTWLNWPMQSVGGDVMRATVTYLDQQNVRLLAPVHDGFLLSCRRDQLADLRAAVDVACRAAVEHSLPGFPLRWDVTVYEGRYKDEEGKPTWQRLLGVIDATSRRANEPEKGEVMRPALATG